MPNPPTGAAKTAEVKLSLTERERIFLMMKEVLVADHGVRISYDERNFRIYVGSRYNRVLGMKPYQADPQRR